MTTPIVESRYRSVMRAHQAGALDAATFERLFRRTTLHEGDLAEMKRVVAEARWRSAGAPARGAEGAARAALEAIELELRCDPIEKAAWAALTVGAIPRRVYDALSRAVPTHSDLDALRTCATALQEKVARQRSGRRAASEPVLDMRREIERLSALADLEAAIVKAGVRPLSMLEAMTCSVRAARAAGHADRTGTSVKLLLAAGAAAAMSAIGHAIPALGTDPGHVAQAFEYGIMGAAGLVSCYQQLKLALVVADAAATSTEVKS